jgi:two-component system, NarL family, response regulator LiaR
MGQTAAMDLMLADDHAIVREGLKVVLAAQADLRIVAEESDGERALAAIRAHRPDVAVLDIQMPGLTGIEVARKLAGDGSLTSVVLLSMHKDASFVQAALDAGVEGYVVKEDAARELIDAIRAVARGDVYLSPRIAGSVVQALRRGPPQKVPQLTPRERDVVRLLSEGLTSKEIAQRLDLSPKTVDGHRAAIMDKLGIRSVAGLVKYAIRNHLTGLDD